MENLSKQGWILTDSALKSLESSGSSKNLMKTLLDRDLREIGAGISDLSKGKFESPDQELAVLQILKIRNISAPKANESSKTAPKLLKLQLTDGVNSYSAIEMESTALSIETRPGTKVCLKVKQLKMTNGQLLLTPKNIEILGGNVEALVTKWELTRSLLGMKGARGATGGGGPPPFIPFGQKLQQPSLPNDATRGGFKSLQASKPKENEIDDSEFKAQRQDAIAEASKAGTKKTFGGGSKMMVDTNVQKVMDKGYTEEQAMTALKFSRNNVEKALSSMKKREEYNKQRAGSNEYEPREYSKEKRFGKASSDEPQAAKPSGGVSLFDFLENKIPATQESVKQSAYDRFENNISSSFRKHDKDFPNSKDSHWSSSGNDYKSSHNSKTSNSYSARDYRDTGPKGYRDRDDFKDNRNREDYRDNRNRDDFKDNRNRDSRDSRDLRSFRDNRDSREPRDGDNRRDTRNFQSNNSYNSKPHSAASNQYQKPPSSAASNGANNNFNNSNGNKEKYQKPEYNSKPGVPQKDYNNFGATTGKYEPSKYRGNESSTGPTKHYNDRQPSDYHKNSRNIVDSMDKMNLKGNQQYKGSDMKMNATNYPPLTQTVNVDPPKAKTYPKPGYPIMGFQNKEANEHAQNALKTKSIPGAPQRSQPPQQQQHQPSKPSSNWQQPKQQTAVPQRSMPPPPFPNAAPVGQAMHAMPQPFAQPQPVIHAMPVISGSPAPGVYHQPLNYPAPIMMQTVAPPPGLHPPQQPALLKSGDMCLAKYWEDGQFYNATVTGVSESTYVVLFTEYGNAEEVRKNDCLPLISACATSATNYATAPQMNPTYRNPQKMPQYNYQQQAPPNASVTYKNVPNKNPRRN